MTTTVTLPLWLLALIAFLAAWAALDRFLVPSVRWFVRRRMAHVIDELNTRLELEIPAFNLTKRRVLIDRLLYDPAIVEAAGETAASGDVPRQVVMASVERYAREIVPAFNAYAYFRVGYRLARRWAEFLYRVRLGYADDSALAGIDANASVVFVMNHRSNMDYVLVAYLAATRTALSYAVGEWARIWPLQTLIRTLGAYFVRRSSGDGLYRLVLARYVQMATAGGVVQAVYPEGGLSRDGRVRPPKLGLLAYMVADFDPDAARDLVFVPVGLNYDRVLEDRNLTRRLDPEHKRRGASFALVTTLRFVLCNVRLMATGRWYRFGYACVNFGHPLSMREYVQANKIDFRTFDRDARFAATEALADRLMAEVARVIPVLPVSLVSTVFLDRGDQAISELELKSTVHTLIGRLEAVGAKVYVPRGDRDYAVSVGLRMLTLRHLVREDAGLYRAEPSETPLLRYYANSIAHFLDGGSRPDAAG